VAGSGVFAAAEGVAGCAGGRISETQVADEHLSLVSRLHGKLQFPCPTSLPVPFTLVVHNEDSLFCCLGCELSADRLGHLRLSSQDQHCS